MSTETQSYVDRPDIQEVFADSARLTHFDGYAVRIELGVSRPHLVGPNQAATQVHTAARLVLSPLAAVQLHEQLGALIANLTQSGLIKRVTPGSEMQQ